MIKILSTLFILSSIFIAPALAGSAHFITGFEDIPLMKGLTQTEAENFSFGNEETRYIETQLTADKKLSFDDIKKFYKETLAQFGWRVTKNTPKQLSLIREADLLEINQTALFPLKISIILKNRI